ncbi:MAG: hypothetical protein NVSMB1_07250 [Polyangiales bacterium]
MGDDTIVSRTAPVVVKGLVNVTSVSFGDRSTFALLANGHVKSWGLNAVGELGNGTTVSSLTPTDVSGLTSVSQIADQCALEKGDVKCWGYNVYGDVGDGTTTDRLVPTSVKW